jgi:hypothetical protein
MRNMLIGAVSVIALMAVTVNASQAQGRGIDAPTKNICTGVVAKPPDDAGRNIYWIADKCWFSPDSDIAKVILKTCPEGSRCEVKAGGAAV